MWERFMCLRHWLSQKQSILRVDSTQITENALGLFGKRDVEFIKHLLQSITSPKNWGIEVLARVFGLFLVLFIMPVGCRYRKLQCRRTTEICHYLQNQQNISHFSHLCYSENILKLGIENKFRKQLSNPNPIKSVHYFS